MSKRADQFAYIIERAAKQGLRAYSADEVATLISTIAEEEKRGNGFEGPNGFGRIVNYTQKGRTRFYNALEKAWPGYQPPQKRVNAKPQIEEPPPPPPPIDTPIREDRPTWRGIYCSALIGGCGRPIRECQCYAQGETPSCIACGGTGKNSKGGPCFPCVRAGRILTEQDDDEPPPPPPPPTTDEEPPPPPPSPAQVFDDEPPPPPPPPPSAEGAKLSEADLSTAPENPPPPPPSAGRPVKQGKAPSFSPASEFRMAVSLKLNTEPDPQNGVVTQEFHHYLVEETNFGASVDDSCQLDGKWYDLLLTYSIHWAPVFEALRKHRWVEDAYTKPAADFGEATLPLK